LIDRKIDEDVKISLTCNYNFQQNLNAKNMRLGVKVPERIMGKRSFNIFQMELRENFSSSNKVKQLSSNLMKSDVRGLGRDVDMSE
jgi:hypothetical protein